jgi:hypothetical protein
MKVLSSLLEPSCLIHRDKSFHQPVFRLGSILSQMKLDFGSKHQCACAVLPHLTRGELFIRLLQPGARAAVDTGSPPTTTIGSVLRATVAG